MDVPSRESAQTTGLDSAARTSGPRNVLGTTPGNARWSYCGGGRVSAGGAPGRGRGARARPHLLHVQPVVEQVVRGLQAEALLHLRVGAGGQVHGGHGHQQPQQPALPARAPRPLPRHPGRQLPRALGDPPRGGSGAAPSKNGGAPCRAWAPGGHTGRVAASVGLTTRHSKDLTEAGRARGAGGTRVPGPGEEARRPAAAQVDTRAKAAGASARDPRRPPEAPPAAAHADLAVRGGTGAAEAGKRGAGTLARL